MKNKKYHNQIEKSHKQTNSISRTLIYDRRLSTFGAVLVVIEWQFNLQLPVQSVSITTKIISSNPIHNKVYSIQHYVIKFVSDLRQIGGFHRVLRFPPPIKLTATI